MIIWYRIFGASDAEPSAAALLEQLNALAAVAGHFRGDDAGWFRAELVVAEIGRRWPWSDSFPPRKASAPS